MRGFVLHQPVLAGAQTSRENLLESVTRGTGTDVDVVLEHFPIRSRRPRSSAAPEFSYRQINLIGKYSKSDRLLEVDAVGTNTRRQIIEPTPSNETLIWTIASASSAGA